MLVQRINTRNAHLKLKKQDVEQHYVTTVYHPECPLKEGEELSEAALPPFTQTVSRIRCTAATTPCNADTSSRLQSQNLES